MPVPPATYWSYLLHSSIEDYISFLAQRLASGYVTFLNQMDLTDCRKEASLLINEKGHSFTESQDPNLSRLVLNLAREISLALQSKQEVGVEMACLKSQYANVLGVLQTVGKKAVKYLHDLHSAKSLFLQSGTVGTVNANHFLH